MAACLHWSNTAAGLPWGKLPAVSPFLIPFLLFFLRKKQNTMDQTELDSAMY
jgi:hypothetical protein